MRNKFKEYRDNVLVFLMVIGMILGIGLVTGLIIVCMYGPILFLIKWLIGH